MYFFVSRLVLEKLSFVFQEFLVELQRYEMPDFVQDNETLREPPKEKPDQIEDLNKRWLALSDWSTTRTEFLTSVISKLQLYDEYYQTAVRLIETKENELKDIDMQVNIPSSADSKEEVAKLEVGITLTKFVCACARFTRT